MAWIYNADIYCEECGQRICDEIKAKGNAPEHPEDEYTFNSDEYPKHADDDDATDCPQHCGNNDDCLNAIVMGDGDKIGCLIGTNLTMDGVQYVKEAIEEDIERGVDKNSSVALGVWAEAFRDYDEIRDLLKDVEDEK